jgi:hypothetical protein
MRIAFQTEMTDDVGDKKMQNGETANPTSARNAAQRATGKARVSPELQELVHMLSSLEDQLTRENGDE